MRKRDGEPTTTGVVTADEMAGAVAGRRHGDGVSVSAPSGPDDARTITIKADAANRLFGIGAGPSGPDQRTQRQIRVQYSGPTLVRYNGLEAARLNAGMLVEDLAANAGLPVRLIEHLEAADEVPEALQFQLAAALDVDLDRAFPTSSPLDNGPDQHTFRELPKPSRAEIAAQREREQAQLQTELAAARDAAAAGRIERLLDDLKRRMTHAEYVNAELSN
jgi:hypothetical protein